MGDDFQNKFLMSIVPDHLLDLEKHKLSLRQHSEENYSRSIAVSKTIGEIISDVDQLDLYCSDLQREGKEKFENIKSEIERLEEGSHRIERERKELELKIAQTRTKLNENEVDVDEANLVELMKKVCLLKNEHENKKKEVKKTFEMYRRGILIFKKYTQCVVFLGPNNEVVLTPDHNASNISEVTRFIKFTTPDNGITFDFVEMQPKLKVESAMVERFIETNDVQGFVLCFLKAVCKN